MEKASNDHTEYLILNRSKDFKSHAYIFLATISKVHTMCGIVTDINQCCGTDQMNIRMSVLS